MTPDWIPNIHPFVVHFPIALLVIAVLFDLARLRFREQSWLHNAVIALYTTGCLSKAAPFLDGAVGEDNWKVDIQNPEKILTVTGENADSVAVQSAIEKAGYKAEPVS